MKTHKTPQEAASLLNEIRELLVLKGENPFKVRAFERAAKEIEAFGGDHRQAPASAHDLATPNLATPNQTTPNQTTPSPAHDQLTPKATTSGFVPPDDLEKLAREGRLTELPGIGKGIAEILTEFFLNGTCRVKEELLASLPAGLIEFTKIPGLGSKKAAKIIEAIDVHSLLELEKACRDNRLALIKGFGEKAQKNILDGIQFLKGGIGKLKLSDALPQAQKIYEGIKIAVNHERHPLGGEFRVSVTGALRRRLEVLNEFEFLVELPPGKILREKLLEDIRDKANKICLEEKSSLPVRIFETSSDRFAFDLVKTTSTDAHWKLLGSPEFKPAKAKAKHPGQTHPETEVQFYQALQLPWIPPEMREGGDEVALARAGKLDEILAEDGIQGIFHVHTTRSDGKGTPDEMVTAALAAGYRYIGISDHSQSAFYANGLKPEDLLAQEKEIRKMQEKYQNIRIFWGIESDILGDGALDYDTKILKRFDFVIASVHSRFKMDKKQMTDRIVRAIQNPATRFVGHLTGRLLLEREGFEVDMERIISEAARSDVAIEINAHPMRLDIDWRQGHLLRQYKTKVSINPDAHATEEVQNTHFGVTVARKALLPQKSVVNSWSVNEVKKWLERKKK